MAPRQSKQQTPPAPLHPFISGLSLLLEYIRVFFFYFTILVALVLFYMAIRVVAGLPEANIRAMAAFVRELGLAWKTLVPGAVLAGGAIGLLSYRNNRLVRQKKKWRDVIEGDDPERSSSGLDKHGRVR